MVSHLLWEFGDFIQTPASKKRHICVDICSDALETSAERTTMKKKKMNEPLPALERKLAKL